MADGLTLGDVVGEGAARRPFVGTAPPEAQTLADVLGGSAPGLQRFGKGAPQFTNVTAPSAREQVDVLGPEAEVGLGQLLAEGGEGTFQPGVAGGVPSLPDVFDIFSAGKEEQAKEEEGAKALTDAQKKANLEGATFADDGSTVGPQVAGADQKIAGILSQGFGAGAAAGLVRKTAQQLGGSEDEAAIRRQDLELARSDQLAAQEDLTAANVEQSEELADIREEQLDDINASNEVAHKVFQEQAIKQRALLDEYQAAKQRYVDTEIGLSPSRGQQIASSVAIAIGAFGAAMRTQQTGVPAVNMAAQVIQQNIDNQLRQQQLELKKAGRVVGFSANAIEISRGIFSDERSSLQAARVMLTQAHIAQVKFVTQRTNSPIVRAQGEKLAADLTASNADADNKLAVGQMEKAKDRATAALQTDAGQRGSAARARGNAELSLALAELKAAKVAASKGQFGQLTVEQSSKRGSGVRQGWEDLKFLQNAIKKGVGVGVFDSRILRPDQEERGLLKDLAKATFSKEALKVNQKYLNVADTILRLRSGAQASESEARRQAETIGGGAGASEDEASTGIEQAVDIFLDRAAVVAIGNPAWAMENFGSEVMSELAARGRLPTRVLQALGM